MDDWKQKAEDAGQIAQAVKMLPDKPKRDLGVYMQCMVLAAKIYGVATEATATQPNIQHSA